MNPITRRTPLALLGLGPMGTPMAKNLLASWGPITVWNRTAARAEELRAWYANIATSPRAAAREITLTVLPDLWQVQSLLPGPEGLLAGWAEQGIESPVLVIHGTVSPVAIADFAGDMLERHGVTVIDAPLSGGVVGAAHAQLSIMVGGDEATARALEPVFAHLGRTVRYLGPSGAGSLAKACNQIVVAGTIAALSESFLLARAGGLDVGVLQELFQGGLARTELVAQKGANWVTADFSSGGSATNQLKDLHFIAESAANRAVTLPTTALVTELFERMVAEGEGELDHTGLYSTLERASSAAARRGTLSEAAADA
ncbi:MULTISPECIES: NAD(P)-dependent oxidoreductase [unclassified Cryobacterium]|uniref:NAD(P)-dependent oxidoreductase n=1 Tax=unclassified Cryobacterium TaxID=2649013 RepID=UPI00106DD018|nr:MULTISPECIES: NAD(P)-dependent oxidoreductase [unclassified Cryobacterium]TFB96413.1 NAD(P)-dependent oxidoreductase [Cryobacterium sp. MDB2-A-1]TFC10501.1 NAD(P)-dependent oxidoreductase [Cryobacterium sp. MDB2-33-2]TFC12697.1 NAD(P)-dependent oxidoreductase [Cryobacterium sp. MDB2-A-2]TFC17091.1 NAD(P)-dependent oxidoreductase [Cryobacterium sp. MDB2-10]TFC23188.1 NAD(P)-dependent oxidoreductase [Cryobacterium sp. MDB1-18-2]